jgi:hypothetical protein
VQWAKNDSDALQALRTGNALVARFDLCGDQTNLVHTSGVGKIDDTGNVGEGD